MKVVVANHALQYGLSRRQVEALRKTLPDELWSGIQEFHLCDDRRNIEVFEYSEPLKTVLFSYVVVEKSPAVLENAVREVLVGLARLQAHSRFFTPLKATERERYEDFVREWLPKCLEAVVRA